MTGADNFGNPKIETDRISDDIAVLIENADSPQSVAASIIGDLQRLQAEETEDSDTRLGKKYDRLAAAYAHGLLLRSSAEIRAHFYVADHWKDFGGHRPNPARHGAEEAMRFAVMRVFDGSEALRKEGSMLSAACWLLAHRGVSAASFKDALRDHRTESGKTGPKALAAEARSVLKVIRDKARGLMGDEEVPAEKRGHVRIQLPVGVSPEALPPLFLVSTGQALVLSASPEAIVQVQAA